MSLALDHLVVAARTLDEGLAWCEARFGLCSEAGGQHEFMGTHNRLFSIASAAFPRAYLEVIAIDPALPAPRRPRWFDLDDPAVQRTLMDGPRLVAWVARCAEIAVAHAALRAGGIDCGAVLDAERATPTGLLRWRISVRADGRRVLAGAAPALIEWGAAHPTDALVESGVALQAMRIGGWPAALAALLPAAIECDAALVAAPITIVLAGPRGPVTLTASSLKG